MPDDADWQSLVRARCYGYGVYDRPVMRILRRFQPDARNLTGTGLPGVLDALRNGRPVIAWIQLGNSLPQTWISPAGQVVRANFAEHAVLLTGYRGGTLSYNNPWTGDRESFPAPLALAWRPRRGRRLTVRPTCRLTTGGASPCAADERRSAAPRLDRFLIVASGVA